MSAESTENNVRRRNCAAAWVNISVIGALITMEPMEIADMSTEFSLYGSGDDVVSAATSKRREARVSWVPRWSDTFEGKGGSVGGTP